MCFPRKVIDGGGIHCEHLLTPFYKAEDPVFTVQKTIKELVQLGKLDDAFDIMVNSPVLSEGRKTHLGAVFFGVW